MLGQAALWAHVSTKAEPSQLCQTKNTRQPRSGVRALFHKLGHTKMFLCNYNVGVFSVSKLRKGQHSVPWLFLQYLKISLKGGSTCKFMPKQLSWVLAYLSCHWISCTKQTPWQLLSFWWAVFNNLRGLCKLSHCWRKRSACTDASVIALSNNSTLPLSCKLSEWLTEKSSNEATWKDFRLLSRSSVFPWTIWSCATEDLFSYVVNVTMFVVVTTASQSEKR